jgi:hypothetical protein
MFFPDPISPSGRGRPEICEFSLTRVPCDQAVGRGFAGRLYMAAGQKKYTVVLVRHGESTWNNENKFTGWYDCPLSEKGVGEAMEAGRLLKVSAAF